MGAPGWGVAEEDRGREADQEAVRAIGSGTRWWGRGQSGGRCGEK